MFGEHIGIESRSNVVAPPKRIVTLRIPAPIYLEFRALCVERRISMNDIGIAAIALAIEELKEAQLVGD